MYQALVDLPLLHAVRLLRLSNLLVLVQRQLASHLHCSLYHLSPRHLTGLPTLASVSKLT